MFETLGVIDYPTFLIGSLLIVLCPGPNSIYVIRTSVYAGPKAAMAAALAVFSGDTVLLLATYFGVAAMIAANPDVFFALKCAGDHYLTYLAVKILLSKRESWVKMKHKVQGKELTLDEGAKSPAAKSEAIEKVRAARKAAREAAEREGTSDDKKTITPAKAYKTALVLSLSNPKAILFMLSFFVPFINTSKGSAGMAFLVLALTLQFWSVIYMTSLTRVGKLLLRFFGDRPVWSMIGNSAVAALFLFFSVKLVLGD